MSNIKQSDDIEFADVKDFKNEFKKEFDKMHLDRNLSSVITKDFTNHAIDVLETIDKASSIIYDCLHIVTDVFILVKNIEVGKGDESLQELISNMMNGLKDLKILADRFNIISIEYSDFYKTIYAVMKTIDVLRKVGLVNGIRSGKFMYRIMSELFSSETYHLTVTEFLIFCKRLVIKDEEMYEKLKKVVTLMKDMVEYYATLNELIKQRYNKNDYTHPRINEAIISEIEKYITFVKKKNPIFGKLSDKLVGQLLPIIKRTLQSYIDAYDMDPNLSNPYIGNGTFKSIWIRYAAIKRALEIKELDLNRDQKYFENRKIQVDEQYNKKKLGVITYDPVSKRLVRHLVNYSDHTNRFLKCLADENSKMTECLKKIDTSSGNVTDIIKILKFTSPRILNRKIYGGVRDTEIVGSHFLTTGKIIRNLQLIKNEVKSIHDGVKDLTFNQTNIYQQNEKQIKQIAGEIDEKLKQAQKYYNEIKVKYDKLFKYLSNLIKDTTLGSNTLSDIKTIMSGLKDELLDKTDKLSSEAKKINDEAKDKLQVVGGKKLKGGKKDKNSIINDLDFDKYVKECIDELKQATLDAYSGLLRDYMDNTKITEYTQKLTEYGNNIYNNITDGINSIDVNVAKSMKLHVIDNFQLRHQMDSMFKRFEINTRDLSTNVRLFSLMLSNKINTDPTFLVRAYNAQNPIKSATIKQGNMKPEMKRKIKKIYENLSKQKDIIIVDANTNILIKMISIVNIIMGNNIKRIIYDNNWINVDLILFKELLSIIFDKYFVDKFIKTLIILNHKKDISNTTNIDMPIGQLNKDFILYDNKNKIGPNVMHKPIKIGFKFMYDLYKVVANADGYGQLNFNQGLNLKPLNQNIMSELFTALIKFVTNDLVKVYPYVITKGYPDGLSIGDANFQVYNLGETNNVKYHSMYYKIRENLIKINKLAYDGYGVILYDNVFLNTYFPYDGKKTIPKFEHFNAPEGISEFKNFMEKFNLDNFKYKFGFNGNKDGIILSKQQMISTAYFNLMKYGTDQHVINFYREKKKINDIITADLISYSHSFKLPTDIQLYKLMYSDFIKTCFVFGDNKIEFINPDSFLEPIDKCVNIIDTSIYEGESGVNIVKKIAIESKLAINDDDFDKNWINIY